MKEAIMVEERHCSKCGSTSHDRRNHSPKMLQVPTGRGHEIMFVPELDMPAVTTVDVAKQDYSAAYEYIQRMHSNSDYARYHAKELDSYQPHVKVLAEEISYALGEGRLGASDHLFVAEEAVSKDQPEILLTADEAISELSIIIPPSKKAANTEATDKVLNDIQAGSVIVTRREIQVIACTRDLILKAQVEREQEAQNKLDERSAEAARNYENSIQDGTLWEHGGAPRHCTLCGQFIGERNAHTTCRPNDATQLNVIHSKVKDIVSYLEVRQGGKVKLVEQGKKRKIPNDLLNTNGDYYLMQNDPLTGVSDEMIEDYFHTAEENRNRTAILGTYVTKSLFGQPVMNLPLNLRYAFLNRPVLPESGRHDDYMWASERNVIAVAALIEPPLTHSEISRMIDMGGPIALRALLKVNRTRNEALSTVVKEPSNAAAVLTAKGEIPAETVALMAVSSDPAILREAAMSPNLTEDDAAMLATSPYEDVRKTIYSPTVGYNNRVYLAYVNNESVPATADQRLSARLASTEWGATPSQLERYPKLLDIMVNDPKSQIAFDVLNKVPMDRRTMQAITGIGSKDRIQEIRDHYYRMSIAGARDYNKNSSERDSMVEYLDGLLSTR